MKTIEIKESKSREANIDRLGDHSDSCIVCGKRTKSDIWVHMNTDWRAVPNDCGEIDDSQGCFPIGPDCAKKIPKNYLWKIR